MTILSSDYKSIRILVKFLCLCMYIKYLIFDLGTESSLPEGHGRLEYSQCLIHFRYEFTNLLMVMFCNLLIEKQLADNNLNDDIISTHQTIAD